VRHAADHGLAVAVQTSGHGRAEPLSGGVLISTRRMDGVRIDPATRVARVEAGTRWAQAGVVGYRISGLRSSRATRLETGSPGSRARECAPSAILG
jgi:hypothetical protein